MKRIGWCLALSALQTSALAAPAVYDCLIEPSQVVELRSTVEGLIEAVHVRRGDRVRRGQVLVELQSKAERLALEQAGFRAQMEGQINTARSRIDYATKKFDRTDQLLKTNMISHQARDEAQAELRLAQAELQVATENRALARIEHRRADEMLAMRTLTSPLNGVVVDRMLNPGDLAEAGTGRKPVLKLAQIDPLRVDIFLPGNLFGKVKAGDRVLLRPVGWPGQYEGQIRMVDRVVDAASGTLVARMDLPNKAGDIASGVRCKAEIEATPAGATNSSVGTRLQRPMAQ